jgi:CHAT domain-containing protein/tetratricopeptide (TPR) repeat protein
VKGILASLLALTAFAQSDVGEYIRTRFEVITPLLRQERFKEAEQLSRELLAKAEKHLPPDSLEIGRILNLWVDCLFRLGLGSTNEALRAAERQLAIKQKALGQEHSEALHAAEFLASVYDYRYEPVRARELMQWILSVHEAKTVAEPKEMARLLNRFAALEYTHARFVDARRHALRARELAERVYGMDSVEVAGILTVIGFIADGLGDRGAARDAFLRSLRIHQTKLGPGARLSIAGMNNLAIHYASSKEWAEARRLYEQANAAREKLLGPDHPDNAIGLQNYGNLMLNQGDWQGARQAFQRALDLRARTLGEQSYYYASAAGRMAHILLLLGEYHAAREHAGKALAFLVPHAGPDHPETIAVQINYAAILSKLGESAAAFRRAVEGASRWTEFVRVSAQTLAERSALSVNNSTRPALGAGYLSQILLDHEELGAVARADAWNQIILSRAMVLDEMAARQRLLNRTESEEVRRLRQKVLDTRARLARLVLSGDSGSAATIAAAIEARDQAENAFAALGANLRWQMRRTRVSFADVAAGLGPGEALVSYARAHLIGRPTDTIVAYVLTGGSEEPLLIPLAPETKMESAVREWRASIAGAAADPRRVGKLADAAGFAAGEALRKLIWDPVAPHIASSRRVFIVPEGPLHLINFQALPTRPGRFLIDNPQVLHLLPAERDLVTGGLEPAESRGLLAMGNPAFNDTGGQPALHRGIRTPSCADLRAMRFASLPATAMEVNEISRMWKEGKPVVLQGKAATKKNFHEQATGKRVVHVATHGFFLGQQCAAESGPLVVSGLALAGANRRAASADQGDDGMLTAEEIAGMDLTGVEWVVLSGCDTGLGEVRASEGVFGLRRAFQTAGAGTVIMSLWPVEDAAALEWIRALYNSRLKQGLSTAESLREAGRRVLARRRAASLSTHPYFWAAFVGAGQK